MQGTLWEEEPRTKVVNLKRESFDIYIGRAGKGRDGYFGNPIRIERYGDPDHLVEVLARFRTYFMERVENDPDFRERVLALRGKRLGCFCAPKQCHGDVIVEWIESREENRVSLPADRKAFEDRHSARNEPKRDDMSNALEVAKAHPNWKKHKAFTLDEAASRAVQEQTVKAFRYLKTIDEAYFAIKATVDHFAERPDGSKSIASTRAAPAVALLRHALEVLEGSEDAEGN